MFRSYLFPTRILVPDVIILLHMGMKLGLIYLPLPWTAPAIAVVPDMCMVLVCAERIDPVFVEAM